MNRCNDCEKQIRFSENHDCQQGKAIPCSVEPPHTPFVGKPNEPINFPPHMIPKV